MPASHIIILSSQEKTNAGERDYTLSIAAHLAQEGLRPDASYHFYKIPDASVPPPDAPCDPSTLPTSNDLYARMPVLPPDVAAHLPTDNVQIIGMGHATCDALLDLGQKLGRAELNYVTHKLDHADHLRRLAVQKTRLFAPLSAQDIKNLDAQTSIDLVTLDAVPHTNSAASCAIDAAAFTKHHGTDGIGSIVNGTQPFVIAVLNAGFDVHRGTHKIYTPYEAVEAGSDGYALGRWAPQGTSLILLHGGPRNLRDETPMLDKGDTHAPQPTTDSFIAGYRVGQRGATQTYVERFSFGLPYNAIKAAYVWAQAPHCIGFISNSEGYGTMDGAILHLSNQNLLLGMFPFAAQYKDDTGARQANIVKYNHLGIAVLDVKHGGMIIQRHPEQLTTPVPVRDGGAQIVNRLRLSAQSARPQ